MGVRALDSQCDVWRVREPFTSAILSLTVLEQQLSVLREVVRVLVPIPDLGFQNPREIGGFSFVITFEFLKLDNVFDI